ncbi:MAG TPA: dTMP kinase [Acidimicrobiales bacterium]|nr:dTMP kinase [Acidimicrobiales bacterium]
MRGRLIALEGIDGSGKTTQARMYASAVRNAMVTVTAEPGATALGAKLRGLLLDPDRTPVAERTEALLLAADRAQHVAEVVEPALAAGRWVVTDRFSGSTLAYQGYGRGLSLTDLRRLVDWATGGIEPDLNVLVDVPVEVSRRRRAGGTDDRLESLGDDFQERVRSGYLSLAAADPGRWVVVDGTGEVDEVAGRLTAAVVARLGSPPPVAP